MTDREWDLVKQCAACRPTDGVPAGFIVDSPWIPGYCGVSTLDFYTDTELWRACYRKIKADFPSLLFFPDHWIEFGMASEPSSFGCKLSFYDNQPVSIGHLIDSADDIDLIASLPVPDPRRDGLMPLALNYYRRVKGPLHDEGEKIRMVASRGPLNIVSFLMSIPEFCVAVKTEPDSLHRLIKTATALVIRWLEAQAEALDYVEGMLVLDDLCGFLSEEEYLEFAQPYLKEIFDHFSFPVKMFHNDNFGNKYITFPYISKLGVNIFNFSHLADIAEARRILGDKVCILGNVPGLKVLTQGGADEVREVTLACLRAHGSASGLILSAGGGASPGMPGENVRAFISALEEYNAGVRAQPRRGK
ncbi:MAG: uroporphyrinogen decarboxylase family protein [Oscillospiraceae bacterium]|nr:uroporphyrinogen decarboxylase family protein [Oscillospiraceae bacterium]